MTSTAHVALAKASEGFDISSLIELVEATSGELGRVQEECANEVSAMGKHENAERPCAQRRGRNEALANLGGKSAVGLLFSSRRHSSRDAIEAW